MIIVGIIFLLSKVFGSNSSDNLFRIISNIEIVIIDNRSNSYFGIYEPESNFYQQSFPLPGIPLDIVSGELNKSAYDEVFYLTSKRQSLNLEYINEDDSMHTFLINISLDEPGFTTLSAGNYKERIKKEVRKLELDLRKVTKNQGKYSVNPVLASQPKGEMTIL